MSQRAVQSVIGQILTDEDLRRRFIARPADTIAAFRAQGLELTRIEVAALLGTDATAWEIAASTIDPRLQRCSLSPD